MRSASAAHWLLSLFVTPERADTVVGDCLEEAESRGVFWFWKAILGSAFAFAMSREIRATWRLFPAIADRTVTIMVFMAFSRIGGWPGFGFIVLAFVMWGIVERRLFPGPPVVLKGSEWWRATGWSVALSVPFSLLLLS